nr:hypothetical protein [uncultured Draconibacterium sp.]
METESDEFKDNIIEYLVKNGKVFGDHQTQVYLPYAGNNEELMYDLLQRYVRIYWPKFIIDDNNRPLIKYLLSIAAGSASKKGLIIRGTVGVGKTATLRVILQFRKDVLAFDPARKFAELNIQVLEPATLITDFKKKEYELFEDCTSQVLFIDDIGLSTDYKNYGTPVNIIEQMIYARYAAFKENPTLELYGTTNITSANLEKVIGERAMSRLLEMVEWNNGLLKGDDRRKSENRLMQWPTFKSSNPTYRPDKW